MHKKIFRFKSLKKNSDDLYVTSKN